MAEQLCSSSYIVCCFFLTVILTSTIIIIFNLFFYSGVGQQYYTGCMVQYNMKARNNGKNIHIWKKSMLCTFLLTQDESVCGSIWFVCCLGDQWEQMRDSGSAGLQINKSSDRSCTGGTIHTNFVSLVLSFSLSSIAYSAASWPQTRFICDSHVDSRNTQGK